MERRLLLFFSILTIFAFIFILTFKNSRGFNQSADIGVKMTLPYQNNQPEKCTAPKYVFPKEALISDEPLPDKVRESFKNVINITACFSADNQGSFYLTEPIEFGGTASMFEPGLFISARHIFLSTIFKLSQKGYPFFLDKDGLPRSNRYQYTFYGTANVNGQAITFPLELIAIGDPYRPQDLAIFKATNLPPQLIPLEFGEPASLDDIVYSSGRVPLFNPLNDLNSISKYVLSNFINFNFKGHISGIVTNLPNNTSTGFKKIYSIRTNLEPGFSGGPVFNEDGKIVGLTVSVSPGLSFSRAISAEDQKSFIKKLENKGIIPKK